MFCKYCGANISNDVKFCPSCGKSISDASETFNDIKNKAEGISKKVDDQMNSAINDVSNSLNGNKGNSNNGMLPTNRELLSYILLTIVTCGIYGYYYIYSLARDINIACEGDGNNTPGLATYLILSFITCGFYSLYWEYKLANRIQMNQQRYNVFIAENGTTVLLWRIFGAFICLFGTFVGTNILIKNTNIICDAYNRNHR